MHSFWIIFKQAFLTKARTKSFIITTLVVAASFFLLANLSNIIALVDGDEPGWLPADEWQAILNAKGDSLRRRCEGNFAGASAPLVLNVLLDHLQRCSAARARKVRA